MATQPQLTKTIKSPLRPKNPSSRLTSAKKEVLELLSEFFCLSVPQISAVRGVSDRATNFTLQILKKDGMLARKKYIDPFTDQDAIPWVYGLSDKGVEAFGGRSFDEHTHILDHELSITKFHLELKARNYRFAWKQDDLKRTVNPDAFFSLFDPNSSGWFNFFLEIERSKKGFDALTEKLRKYRALFDTDTCEREWGFGKFRVLLVHRNRERADNLLEHLSHALPNRMFWIGIEGSFIFRTPKDRDQKTYSFEEL